MTSLADATLRGYPWRRAGYGLRRLASLYRSSVSRRSVPAARAPKLIFDPLEPRLLLNADAQVLALNLNALPANTPHDVIVQLINETTTTNGQTTTQPQVEIVAANNPNQVLASAALSQISSVSIQGSNSADQVTINAASFAGVQAAPTISFAGGGGSETLAISNSTTSQNSQPQASSWFIDSDANGTDSGHILGSVNVTFSGVNTLQGSGADSLTGSIADNQWTITGSGSGTVGNISFSGFANLAGAANQNNVFTVTTTGLQGTISGGGQGTIVNESGVTDVVKDGSRVVGYGFNSNGRYGQGGLIRERFADRILQADP
jgi:hypothetical protein